MSDHSCRQCVTNCNGCAHRSTAASTAQPYSRLSAPPMHATRPPLCWEAYLRSTRNCSTSSRSRRAEVHCWSFDGSVGNLIRVGPDREYQANCAEARGLALEASPLYEPLAELAREDFIGTVAELHARLELHGERCAGRCAGPRRPTAWVTRSGAWRPISGLPRRTGGTVPDCIQR